MTDLPETELWKRRHSRMHKRRELQSSSAKEERGLCIEASFPTETQWRTSCSEDLWGLALQMIMVSRQRSILWAKSRIGVGFYSNNRSLSFGLCLSRNRKDYGQKLPSAHWLPCWVFTTTMEVQSFGLYF